MRRSASTTNVRTAQGAHSSSNESASASHDPDVNIEIQTLVLEARETAHALLKQAFQDALPACHRYGWQPRRLRELAPDDADVGYTDKDGTISVKVRDPAKAVQSSSAGSGKTKQLFYPYSFVLATLLHELTHLSYLGHGKAFYRRLVGALQSCNADPGVRREARACVCSELLNAVCENDARRARALLTVLPEAVAAGPQPGKGSGEGAGSRQLPLEYAAHHGRVALTRLLLEARADVSATRAEGAARPLERAAANGNLRTAQLLLAAGAENSVDDGCCSKCSRATVDIGDEPACDEEIGIANAHSSIRPEEPFAARSSKKGSMRRRNSKGEARSMRRALSRQAVSLPALLPATRQDACIKRRGMIMLNGSLSL